MTEQTASKVPQIRFKGFEEGWEEKTLGDLCEPLSYGLNAAAMKFDGANKYLRITDIDDETRTFRQSDITSPNKDLSTSANYVLEPGDIVFARTGASVGKTYLYRKEDGRVFFAGFLIRARTKANVDEEFIFQNTLLSKYRAFVKLTSQRSGQPGINAQEYSFYSLNCPYPEEQTLIGGYFRELDSLIGLHQRKHDKLVTLKKAMLQKMFPQAGATTPEIRFKGFSGKWKVEPVSSLLTERNIQAPKSDQYPLMAFIAGQGVAPKGKRYNREFLVSDEANKKYKQTELGDFIYSSNNLETGSIGINKFGSASISPVYSIFSPTQDGDPDFIGHLLCQKTFVSEMVKWRQGVVYGQWRIHESDFLRIETTFPFVDEQKKIGTYFRTLDELISQHATQLQKLQQIKSACLERMFV